MDNNFSESKRNLSRAPQETELGSVPVNQWPSPYTANNQIVLQSREQLRHSIVNTILILRSQEIGCVSNEATSMNNSVYSQVPGMFCTGCSHNEATFMYYSAYSPVTVVTVVFQL